MEQIQDLLSSLLSQTYLAPLLSLTARAVASVPYYTAQLPTYTSQLLRLSPHDLLTVLLLLLIALLGLYILDLARRALVSLVFLAVKLAVGVFLLAVGVGVAIEGPEVVGGWIMNLWNILLGELSGKVVGNDREAERARREWERQMMGSQQPARGRW